RQIDFALHQVAIHFPDTHDPKARAELTDRAVTQWPRFALKLNPLGLTQELTSSATWAGGQTMVGGVAAAEREAGGANFSARRVRPGARGRERRERRPRNLRRFRTRR